MDVNEEWDAVLSQDKEEEIRRFSVGIARSLAVIAAENCVDSSELVEYLLYVALTNVSLPSSDEVVDSWVRVALAIIPHMERAAVNMRIIPFALARAQTHGHTVQGRLMCCALLGAAAWKLHREDIEHQFLQKAVALCQDTDKLVRQCMCEQLPALAHALGRDPTAAVVLPEILELAEDEEKAVRCAAICALGDVLHLLPAELLRAEALPFVRALCSAADISPDVKCCVARLFCGQLIQARPPVGGSKGASQQVAAEMDSESDVVMLLAAFRNLATAKDAKCRALCATALPKVLRGATPRRYSTHLHETLNALAADMEVEVRVQMAAGYHDCAVLLGPDRCIQYMRRSLLNLLGDSAVAVREAVVAQLPGTLKLFAALEAGGDVRAGSELANALVALDASLGLDWRSQQSMLLSFPALSQILSGDQIYDRFVPIALHHMAMGSALTRAAAAGAAVAFLRCVRKPYQRTELLARLLREYARGRSCSRRLVFLDACHALLKLFSARFFKAHVMNPVLELLSDGVIGVRLRAVGLLPHIRQVEHWTLSRAA
ncbi:g1409 [Coccomyxa elongata]